MNYTKHIKYIFIYLLISTSIFAQSNQSLQSQLDSLISSYTKGKTIVSVLAYNTNADSVIYKRDEKLLLHPASNMKILTSAAGLYFLSPDYEFSTDLYYTGKISGNTLKGNIFIKGGFDPDLTKDDLEKFAEKILDLGIETIEGNIYSDVSLHDENFWGEGWMWDDDPYSDFPYMSSLNVNDDCVKIIVSPTSPGAKAKVEILPHSLFYTFENNLITDTSGSRYYVTRDWKNRKNHFLINGTINYINEPDTLIRNVVNTDLYAPTLLKEILYREGVNTLGIVDTSTATEDTTLIGSVKRKYSDVIINLNKTSDNLSAEMTLRALGHKIKPSHVSAKDGILFIDSLISLAGKNPADYRIVDGSGVSHYNLISTELVFSILNFMKNHKPQLFDILIDSFPIAGIDGTLKNRMKDGNAFMNVHAKTGTLSGVSSLSGILHNKHNEEIIFSIFIQNFVGSAKNARNLQDSICEILSSN